MIEVSFAFILTETANGLFMLLLAPLASLMFNSDLKPRHKLQEFEANGPTQRVKKGN